MSDELDDIRAALERIADLAEWRPGAGNSDYCLGRIAEIAEAALREADPEASEKAEADAGKIRCV